MLIPQTPILGLYQNFKAYGNLRWTKTWLNTAEATPAALANTFAASVASFGSYSNVDQPFHGNPGGHAPPLAPWTPPMIRNGHDFVRALEAGVAIGGWPPGVSHIDRELDCLRVAPTAHFPDGSVANEAIVPDLLLSSPTGFPALAEVKVFTDRNAVYALVQVLAAAAHLVTPNQRARLSKWYPSINMETGEGPYLDVYVVLHEMPDVGLRVDLRKAAMKLAQDLLQLDEVTAMIRDIRVIDTTDPAPPLDEIPPDDAPWHPDISTFAVEYDGYAAFGGFEPLSQLAKRRFSEWQAGNGVPTRMRELRSLLYYEQRLQWHAEDSGDHAIIPERLAYAREIIRAIRAGAVKNAG